MGFTKKRDAQTIFSFESSTEGISVNVTPVFIEQESNPEDHFYLWAYQVRIENKGEKTIRILDRQWSVIDGRGAKRTITGAGVFDDHPTLKPGDAFEYTNTIPLKTTSGLISGKYAVESNDSILEIAVPLFSLDSPYGTQLLN